jgi:hypothetical protein
MFRFSWLSSPTPKPQQQIHVHYKTVKIYINIQQLIQENTNSICSKLPSQLIKIPPTVKMPKIVRLTLFKIPDQDMVKEAIQMYNTLAQDAKKVRTQFLEHNSS